MKEVEDDEVVSPLKPVIRIANDNDREKVNENFISVFYIKTLRVKIICFACVAETNTNNLSHIFPPLSADCSIERIAEFCN